MSFWHWLRGRPSVDADQQADQSELDGLRDDYDTKMRDIESKIRRSESLREEIRRLEYPHRTRRSH